MVLKTKPVKEPVLGPFPYFTHFLTSFGWFFTDYSAFYWTKLVASS